MKKKRLALLLTAFIIMTLMGMFFTGCKKENKTTALESGEGMDSEMAARLDEFMTAYNENCTYKYNGTVLVAKGGSILLKKGYGMADFEEKIPNEPDKVFAIGSISKSFTATAIMQLQEKGLLNVNDPISKYIEGNERGDDITIHQLLTHTSGIVRDGLILGSLGTTLEADVEFINKKPLLFEPGEDYSYSNAGYVLLAAIIEKVSGKSYKEYISDNIFKPLHMGSSKVWMDASYCDNQAIGYEILRDAPKKWGLSNFSWEIGCGNIFSTVEDLYKYDRAHYGEKLLSRESLDKMFTAYRDTNYGYGWDVKERFGHREISHGGHIYGYFSSIIRFPDDDIVLIFLLNNNDNKALTEVSGTMPAIVLGQNYVMPERLNEVKVNSEVLKKYTGRYEFDEGLSCTVNYSSGKLYSDTGDGIAYELVPISEVDFYIRYFENSRSKFILDKSNNATGLEIISNGLVHRGKKVNN